MAGRSKTTKPDPAAELAAKLLVALDAKKARGEYPISLRRLAETSDAVANPDVLLAAVGKTLFTKVAFLVRPPDKKKRVAVEHVIESPVGLWEDAKLVACHPATLAFVRAALPGGTVADWKSWVNDTKRGVFRRAFSATLDARSLLDALRSRQVPGEAGYPLTLRALAEVADRMPLANVATAMTTTMFADAVLIAANLPKTISAATVTKLADAPLALREDSDRLAESALLLEHGVWTCRKTKDCAFHVEEIATKLFGTAKRSSKPELRSRFVQVTNQKLDSGSMPRTIGWISKKSKALLFFVEDLFPQAVRARPAHDAAPARQTVERAAGPLTARSGFSALPPANASAASPAVDERFAARFEEAFRRLDRDRGSNNFVWLTELRRAMADYTREHFDAGLRRLRKARRYKINAAEGHFGITDEQKESSIYEAGTIYLSVSRIDT